MAFLNYHHLRYFHAIVVEGNLTRAAQRLSISQSALSLQLRKLEESLGQPLFLREHKRLELSEAGRIAFDYASQIFRAGEELQDTLSRLTQAPRRILRAGASSTLSRNFQIAFFAPLMQRDDCELIVHSGPLTELIERLKNHDIDLVLSNREAPRDTAAHLRNHLISRQAVSLVGRPGKHMRNWKFPEDMESTPLVLPTLESDIRTEFDVFMDRHRIHPKIAAEIDDMAMLRLMAREWPGLTLVPPVVVQDELRDGLLKEYHRFTEITETFYSIVRVRRFPNPIVHELLAHTQSVASWEPKLHPRESKKV